MKRKNFSNKKSAFSLIELSIVLIIIGLLIAGVTGGASLIKSSELRAAVGEARAFATSVNGFYNQFNAYPGDYGTAISVSTAFGDGDGTIEYNSGAAPSGGTAYESRAAWVQMKGAAILDSNLLSGATTLVAPGAGTITFGQHIPASKIKSAGWDFAYASNQNVVVLTGAITSANTDLISAPNATGAITPTDALSIDTKVDDGVANTGKVKGVLSGCFSSTVYTTATTSRACAISYQVDISS